MRRAYISGFTGSAGTAVVTKHKATLWTDGQYFLQAEKQLSLSWILMRADNWSVPNTTEWLNDVLPPGGRIGKQFLFSYDVNLVDEVWKESRPMPQNKPIQVHDLKFFGVDVSTKLSNLRSELTNAGSSAIVISMLDEVA